MVFVFISTVADHTLTSLPSSVFEVLRSEARVMEGLRSLHIETPYIHDILKLNVQPSDSDYAVDIRNSAISVRNPAAFAPFVKLWGWDQKVLTPSEIGWLFSQLCHAVSVSILLYSNENKTKLPKMFLKKNRFHFCLSCFVIFTKTEQLIA